MTKVFAAFHAVYLAFAFTAVFAEVLPEKEWTILIYLNADNDLETYGFSDIREMEKIGSTPEINVVVQFDQVAKAGTPRIFIEKTEGAYADPKFSFNSPVVMDLPEQDMGDWRVFSSFVKWGIENYPAQHYAVIFWNHGSGWKKDGPRLTPVKGISYDLTSDNHITMDQMEMAFSEIRPTLNRNIDVVGFDACLMGMIEIADILAPFADYMLASEEIIPVQGFPYDGILRSFAARESKTPERLVRDIGFQFLKSYNGGSQGIAPVQLAGLDLHQYGSLKNDFNSWLLSVKEESGLTPAQLFRAAGQALRFHDQEYRDLADYIERVMDQSPTRHDEDAYRIKTISLLNSIENFVVENFASRKYARSSGLSIYLPYVSTQWSPWASRKAEDQDLKARYLDLSFSSSTSWPAHLDQLFPIEY